MQLVNGQFEPNELLAGWQYHRKAFDQCSLPCVRHQNVKSKIKYVLLLKKKNSFF